MLGMKGHREAGWVVLLCIFYVRIWADRVVLIGGFHSDILGEVGRKGIKGELLPRPIDELIIQL